MKKLNKCNIVLVVFSNIVFENERDKIQCWLKMQVTHKNMCEKALYEHEYPRSFFALQQFTMLTKKVSASTQ